MQRTLRSELKNILSLEQLDYVPKSFDIIGSKGRSVAIIEIPEDLETYKILIADALMRVHGNVRSVLSKGSERLGDYRIRQMKLISGDPNTEVIHRESGCIFKVDPAKVYFSPRESTERERISSMVSPNEEVLVMFSGIGPFAICIAKRQPASHSIAVELNPDAHKMCIENLKLNKVSDKVEPILGDVREICPKLGKQFDRVLMPLPKGAFNFLDVAVKNVKSGGILHFYHWANRMNLFDEAEELIKEEVKKQERQLEIINKIKVAAYSPSSWKVRIDARLS